METDALAVVCKGIANADMQNIKRKCVNDLRWYKGQFARAKERACA